MKNQKVIAVIVVILAALGLGGFKYYQTLHPEKFQTEEKAQGIAESDESVTVTGTESGQTSSSSIERESHAAIVKEKPINGKRYGVIEVGASGFNSFVVDIDQNDRWELVSKEFGESLAYEGFATVEDVKLGLKKYLATSFEKGVAGRNIHFVISSGALKNPKTTLIAKALDQMGYFVNKVNATQEGQYAFASLMDDNYKNNSFVVDMGSGNTKISWLENGRVKSIECSGAKYYQDKGKDDQSVYYEIADAVRKVPERLKQNCFIIGGGPFKLAKEVRSGEERFTYLANPKKYSYGDDVKKRSALIIYKALWEESKCNNFIFDWDANFTIGFLLGLN